MVRDSIMKQYEAKERMWKKPIREKVTIKLLYKKRPGDQQLKDEQQQQTRMKYEEKNKTKSQKQAQHQCT